MAGRPPVPIDLRYFLRKKKARRAFRAARAPCLADGAATQPKIVQLIKLLVKGDKNDDDDDDDADKDDKE